MSPVWADPNGEYYIDLGTPSHRKWDPLPQHDCLAKYWGSLLLQAKVLTPLFIGSGEYELKPGSNFVCLSFARVPDPRNAARRLPVVPGSSLKGALRAYAEALSPSCEVERGGCGVCVCCQIFGSLGSMGRLTVLDAGPLAPRVLEFHNIQVRFGLRNKDRNGRRFYYHDSPDKWSAYSDYEGEWVETLRAGAQFPVLVQMYNLGAAELGLLCLALGIASQWPFALKIGGGKNRGLGSVCFTLEAMGFSDQGDSKGDPYRTWDPEVKALSARSLVDAYLTSLRDEERAQVGETAQRWAAESRQKFADKFGANAAGARRKGEEA